MYALYVVLLSTLKQVCMSVRSVFDVPHVLWIDNYAHILHVNLPNATSGWTRNSLWSAKAAVTLDSLRGSTIVLKENPNSGMPDCVTIFSDETKARFRKIFVEQEHASPLCFESSLSKTVRQIPIKPLTAETQAADLDRKFVPLGILGHNIGSNAGLFKILMEIRAEEQSKPHTPALLVDCNIYWRVMKVLFL